jgi:hypothetical protein
MKAAHGMRHGAHGGHDVIVPVYETLLGKDFAAESPFASVFHAGGKDDFVGDMLTKTAQVVAKRSEPVQNRVHGH